MASGNDAFDLGARLFRIESLLGGQLREILRRFFLEIGEAVLTAELNLLALVDERVGFAVVEAFVGDEAFGERIRLRGGRAVRVAGMVVAAAGAAGKRRAAECGDGSGYEC